MLNKTVFRFASKKLFVGGNWKSNNTVAQTKDIMQNVVNKLAFDASKVDVVIAPPTLHIPLAHSLLSNKNVHISAQNSSLYGYGAYTGEISPLHLKDFGINWVILGHSERRALFGEHDQLVADKVRIALKSGLKVIFCFGETLEERKADKTQQVISRQLEPFTRLLKELNNPDVWYNDVVLAYEPVWAIGTGLSSTPEQAQEVNGWLRQQLKQWVPDAERVRIIYGGSVTEKNTPDLIKQKDVDGFLVGGASLKPAFIDIVKQSAK